MPGKRQKTKHSEVVLLSCIDSEDLVEISRPVLENSSCRLGLVVEHTKPLVAADGSRYWRTSMTRPLLLTFVRSLTLGELVLQKEVSVGEALAQLEYEGLQLHRLTAVEAPRAGIAFRATTKTPKEALKELCTFVAGALLAWPRLEAAMNASLALTSAEDAVAGRPPPSSSLFSVTANRAWIRFSEREKAEAVEGDAVSSLALKAPRWLTDLATAMGVVHSRLVTQSVLSAKDRTEASFKKLVAAIEADELGAFFSVRYDITRGCSAGLQREVRRGERFFEEVRTTIVEALTSGAKTCTGLQFCRACIGYLERMQSRAPSLARVFSAACADDRGLTEERTALKAALKARRVRVIRWQDEREASVRPLSFPPGARDGNCAGPALLLSFEET